ncbi:MAG: TonB-dependent receptor plug domain-containing protein, partial [Deltaproteobacteria bacterium]|nr:TonB-dependent receptor plug domain-containing protein [Deltaproteobacteria bacterium]
MLRNHIPGYSCYHCSKPSLFVLVLSAALFAAASPVVAAAAVAAEAAQTEPDHGTRRMSPESGAASETREVVVTATRTEREVFEVPSSVSVVNKKTMEREPKSTIAEQLQDVPGIQVSDGGMGGGAKRIGIRGEGPSRALILIDGMKISEQKS